jgi:hypothetical protein
MAGVGRWSSYQHNKPAGSLLYSLSCREEAFSET